MKARNSRILFYTILVSSVLFLLTCNPVLAAENDPDKEEWVQLFNGANLDGWIPKIAKHETNDNFANTFRVEDGIMKVSFDGYGDYDSQYGNIFYKDPFSYYRIAVEYRFVGEQAPGGPDWAFRNSGIMVHSQSPSSMPKDQDFPISIEVQLLGGSGQGERPTANLCTPGSNVEMNGKLFTPHCLSSKSKTYHGDQWVRVEVVVLGDSQIQHWVEGEVVLSYERPQIGGGQVNGFDPALKKDGQLLSEGYIALQSESHPIEFRKVELLNLVGCTDPKASNFKNYFVKSDNSKCVYDPES